MKCATPERNQADCIVREFSLTGSMAGIRIPVKRNSFLLLVMLLVFLYVLEGFYI